MHNKLYLIIFGVVFAAAAVVFDTFPRSTFSTLEKRDLAEAPAFSTERLLSGQYTREVSHWFSDSEPYRDRFMALSMYLKKISGIAAPAGEEEAVTFHDTEAPKEKMPMGDNRTMEEYENTVNVNENAKIAANGIIVVGAPPKARALPCFKSKSVGGRPLAEMANLYKKTFPKCNVYVMAVPLATEFYCPKKTQDFMTSQLPTIRNLYSHLDSTVKAVDVYTPLSQHVKEDIYLRTDHHWAPLGAFYAARQFARVAGVPFKELDSYERCVTHDFVGTMYNYSHDVAIKNSPEDFVYYVPRGVDTKATYVLYHTNKNWEITRESKPHQDEYFHHHKDGSGSAYATFMNGESLLCTIRTATKNGRRLVILKDSYGAAIPGYLFYSFEEIHVIDFRYFTKDIVTYVKDNKITDILFCFNIFNSSGDFASRKLKTFIGQTNFVYADAAGGSAKGKGAAEGTEGSAKPKKRGRR